MSQITIPRSIKGLFTGVANFWIENDLVPLPKRGAKLDQGFMKFNVNQRGYGGYFRAPRIMYSPNEKTPFTPFYAIGFAEKMHPDNFIDAYISRPFTESPDQLKMKMKQDLRVSFPNVDDKVINKIAKIDFIFATALQIFMIAKALSIPIAPLPDDNESFISTFLHEVRMVANTYCPNKAKPYEELEKLEDPDIIQAIIDNIESDVNLPFIKDSAEQILKIGAVNPAGTANGGPSDSSLEETPLEEDGRKEFMIGRLVILALKRCELFRKIKGNDCAKIFENEKKIPIPSIMKQSVTIKKTGAKAIYMNARLEFVIQLEEGDRGYNEKMFRMITHLIPVRGREKISVPSELLNLERADKYLWGMSEKVKQMFHKCIISATPQFDLGFYQNGSPHTSWRVGKIVTESSQGSGGADYVRDEDEFFTTAATNIKVAEPDCEDWEDMEPASLAAFK
jgi:hypothetical protein